MFTYGRKAGIMGIVLTVLAIVPAVVCVLFVFQMPLTVPTHFVSGMADRFGSRYELLIAPSLALAACWATYLSAKKQAAQQTESRAMAQATAERYLRNGIVTGVVLNLASYYLLFTTVNALGWLG